MGTVDYEGPVPHYAQCPCPMLTQGGEMFVFRHPGKDPDCRIHTDADEWLEPGEWPVTEPARCDECQKILNPAVGFWRVALGGTLMKLHIACVEKNPAVAATVEQARRNWTGFTGEE